MFSVLKLQHLLSKHNPQVNSFVERDAFDDQDVYWAEDDDEFMIAFLVTHFIKGDVKNDPKYVKWFAEFVLQEDGVFSYGEVPMHVCNETDFAKFHPPNRAS